MARTLDVYLDRDLIGHYTQDDHGDTQFRYSDAWLQNAGAIPLSHSLPLRTAPFVRRECRSFFAGILPEAEKRQLVARNLGISANNDYSMLERIGGECAGAVTFVPAGQALQDEVTGYRSLTEAELVGVLRELPRRPLLAGDGEVRLSLAGAQDKIAVCLSKGRLSIPLGDAPSTHILKPAIDKFEGTVYNESLCMKLAHAVGLPTANVLTNSVEGIDYLLVERYDRTGAGSGELERLHQEDFCQALGILPEHKYQNEGGPSHQQCFQLLRDASAVPVLDLSALLDAAIFNFIIGNNDAHGKNFSLLYHGKTATELKIRLAPFYDLLCTAYYSDLSDKMAMKLGGEYVSDRVTLKHFERFAEDTGFGKPQVLRRLRALADAISSNLSKMNTAHHAEVEVADLISKRSDRVRAWFQS